MTDDPKEQSLSGQVVNFLLEEREKWKNVQPLETVIQHTVDELEEIIRSIPESDRYLPKKIADQPPSPNFEHFYFISDRFIYSFTEMDESDTNRQEIHWLLNRLSVPEGTEPYSYLKEIDNDEETLLLPWEDEIQISKYIGEPGNESIGGNALSYRGKSDPDFIQYPGSQMMSVDERDAGGFTVEKHVSRVDPLLVTENIDRIFSDIKRGIANTA